MSGVRDTAVAALEAGISVVPPRQDGSKAPLEAWKQYQTNPATLDQVEAWYSDPNRTGVGFVGGEVSGGLELFEFEGRAVKAGLLDRWKAALDREGLRDLWAHIVAGYSERTPSGGFHVLYRCTETGCVKLAKTADGKDLIETKGEGGYMITAPTNGTVHPNGGTYEQLDGGIDTIVTISPGQRRRLLELAAYFDERPPPDDETPAAEPGPFTTPGGWMSQVVAAYNVRTTWTEVLAGRFTHLFDRGGVGYWHYEGADNVISATTNATGRDTLIVFSGTAQGAGWHIWEGRGKAPSYDRFSAHVLIETGRHDTDTRVEAAAKLQAEGYGPPAPEATGTGEIPAITVVTLEEFTAVDEPGAEPLLGEGDDAVIPANGDVMFYGDGGAGKTTLTVDLGCHFGAGDTWLGIPVPRPLTVLVVENEGPRPLFRKKLTRKKNAWAGSPLNGRVRIVEDPWATLGFADDVHRHALANAIAAHSCDVVIIGPVSKSGMTEAGTLAEVRGFTTLVAEVRHRAGRPVTFALVHHENRAGTPSGAWEGAVDTLFHVRGMGHGHTRLHVQKARWSSTWHAQTLELSWAEGDSYTVDEKPEISDDNIADSIIAYINENPSTGWTKVADATPGVQRQHRQTIRDRLFADGVIVNIVKEDGHDTAIYNCPPRRTARLYPTSDPAIAHLLPGWGAGGEQTAPPTDGPPTASAPLLPDSKEGAGEGADAGEPSDLFNT